MGGSPILNIKVNQKITIAAISKNLAAGSSHIYCSMHMVVKLLFPSSFFIVRQSSLSIKQVSNKVDGCSY